MVLSTQKRQEIKWSYLIAPPLDDHQVTTDHEISLVMLAHPFRPHLIGDGRVVARYEVMKHQFLYTGCRCYPTDIFGRSVAGNDMFPQCRRISDPLKQRIEARYI